jgi:hypothetical protein
MADGGSSTRNPHYFPCEAGSIRDPEVHRATLHYTRVGGQVQNDRIISYCYHLFLCAAHLKQEGDMPRQARIAVQGVIYHVTARGNNRNRIIHDDGSFATFLSNCDPTKRKGVRLCQQT